jgi:hypothetical protein
MDGNVFDFSSIVREAREALKHVPTYHVGELFNTIRSRTRGEISQVDHGALHIELESYSCVSIPRATGTFTDPYDGKLYRIIVEPVEKKGAVA